MGGSKVVPQNGWFTMKNTIKMDDLETPIWETPRKSVGPQPVQHLHVKGRTVYPHANAWTQYSMDHNAWRTYRLGMFGGICWVQYLDIHTNEYVLIYM